MPDQFAVKKACGPIGDNEFYRFLYTYYFHQDNLAWSRTQYLLAIEVGILAVAFSKHGPLALLALLLGSVLVLLIWHLIQRDWQVRDQYNLYFDEFHKEWGVNLIIPAKSYWYRGSRIIQAIAWSVIAFNLCSAAYLAYEMCRKLGLSKG